MVPRVTLLELVAAVVACARTEAEAVATVAYMVNARKVQLVGRFRRIRFDVRGMLATPGAPPSPAAEPRARRPALRVPLQRARSSRCA